MDNTLFWLYFINAIFLIIHEIDSAYWQEWKLFKIPGGISFFLILHFPLLFLILFGLIQVYLKTKTADIFSIILAICGLSAFIIHMTFIKKGCPEFKKPVSLFILIGAFIFSLLQLIIVSGLL